MYPKFKFAVGSMLVFAASHTLAETPAEIFAKMDEQKRASYAGISNYTQKKTVMGLCTVEHYEKELVTSSQGDETIEYMRLVPISEITERHSPDSPMATATPADLERTAAALRAMGPEADALFREKVSETGLPGGIGSMILSPPPDQPWLSANPKDMLNSYATMFEGAAQGKRDAKDREAEARSDAMENPLASVANNTRVAGRETIGNREAIHLVTENMDRTQSTNNQDFTLKTMHLWVDAEKYVPLKMVVEGTATQGNEPPRDLSIERIDSYQAADDCGSVYEPFRSEMRIAGIMTPEEQQQMVEAQAQLEEAKQQLESLPENQKAMIMRQLGPQMKALEGLASGEGMSVVSLVTAMRCNAGLPDLEEYMAMMPGSADSAMCYGFRED